MSGGDRDEAKGETRAARSGARGARERTAHRTPRGQAFWIAAVIALPVALVVWVALTAALALAIADFALGGLIALGVVAVVGCLLVLRPRTRGSGVGALAGLVPCALGLALTLV